jgi:hypothetical protein
MQLINSAISGIYSGFILIMKRLSIVFLFFGACIAFVHESNTEIAVTGPLFYEHVLQPGSTVKGTIEVLNRGDRTETVNIHQSDYQCLQDGEIMYSDPGTTNRSNASWITFRPKVLTIPPHAGSRFVYSMTMPASQVAEGSCWSMLMIEQAEQQDSDSRNDGRVIRTTVRFAVKMVCHRGNTGKVLPVIDFQGAAHRRDGGADLSFELGNAGNRMAALTIRAELFDSCGFSAGIFPVGSVRIIPGCRVHRIIDTGGINYGSYRLRLTAENTDGDVFIHEQEIMLK